MSECKMKKQVIYVIALSIIILSSVIITGTYYLKHTELPPVVPFVIITIILFFILLSINIAVINKKKS
jgi:hypothetical protein